MSKKSSQKGSKFTENWVPVKKIAGGMIYLDSGEKVTGVKITPRNIFILDAAMQNRILDNIKNLYNRMDYEFWLIIADRPVDISIYMSQLQLLYNKTTSPAIRKIIMEDINKGSDFVNNNIVDTEYYILFKDKDVNVLQKRVRDSINNLAAASLYSSQASDDDLRTLLDNFLNGGQRTEFRTVVGI